MEQCPKLILTTIKNDLQHLESWEQCPKGKIEKEAESGLREREKIWKYIE